MGLGKRMMKWICTMFFLFLQKKGHILSRFQCMKDLYTIYVYISEPTFTGKKNYKVKQKVK